MYSLLIKSIGLGSFQWDFGDNQNSQEMNPEHEYPGEGSYIVSLMLEKYLRHIYIYGYYSYWKCLPEPVFSYEPAIGLYSFNGPIYG